MLWYYFFVVVIRSSKPLVIVIKIDQGMGHGENSTALRGYTRDGQQFENIQGSRRNGVYATASL